MLENIWRGLSIDYQYLLNHGIQVTLILLVILTLILFKLLTNVRQQQKKSYNEFLAQQHNIDQIQYQITRLHQICNTNRDKQRFISTQLNKVDDSIFELENRLNILSDSLRQQTNKDLFSTIDDTIVI